MRYLCNLLYFSIILDVRSFPSCAPGNTDYPRACVLLYCTCSFILGIVNMDQECTLATHGPIPDQGQGPDHVLAASSDAEGEEAGGTLTTDGEKESAPPTVAHRVDLEAEAEVGTVIHPVGEVGVAISSHDQDEDRILGVRVHV